MVSVGPERGLWQARGVTALQPTTAVGADALQAVLAQPDRTLLALDFDGTLAPIIDDPEQAVADPAAVAALAEVGALIGTVAVITGRPARTAVRLGRFAGRAGLESMVVLGQYGVERWDGAEDRYTIPPEPAEVTAAADELPAILGSLGLEGARIEHKGRAVGVHTRELPDARAAFSRLLPSLRELAERHGLQLEPGRNVLEIRAPGTDKGAALRSLVSEVGARQVVFGGDDLGDLPAFEAVEQLRTEGVGGLLLCSASTEEDTLRSRADVVVDGPPGVAAWLQDLAAQLRGGC